MFFRLCICCKMSFFFLAETWFRRQALSLIPQSEPLLWTPASFHVSGDVFLFVHPYKESSEFAPSWELPESVAEGGRGKGKKLRVAVIFLCQFRNLAACRGRGLSQSQGSQHRELHQPWRGLYLQLVLGGTSLPLSFPGTFSPLGASCLHSSSGTMSCQGQAESKYCWRLLTLWAWISYSDTPPFH